MKNFCPKDVIALGVIAAMVILKIAGVGDELDAAVALIIGYYFAKRTESRVVVDPEKMPTI